MLESVKISMQDGVPIGHNAIASGDDPPFHFDLNQKQHCLVFSLICRCYRSYIRSKLKHEPNLATLHDRHPIYPIFRREIFQEKRILPLFPA